MGPKQHDEHECKQADRLMRLDQEVARVNKVVFYDADSVISQLAVQRKTTQALTWLVAVTCVSVVGQIVMRIFAK